MPIEFDGVNSKVSADKLQGQTGTTITIESGHSLSGSGAGLTALNASNLASGTVPTARLGSGTASSSTFLRGDSTYATAGGINTPSFAAYHTGTISISANTATAITLGSEYFDTDSAYNTSDGKFTVPSGKGGKYWLFFQYRVQQGNTNTRQVIMLNKNGSLIGQEMETRKAASTGYLGINHSVLVALSAGDYVQGMVQIIGGGTQSVYDFSFYGFKLIE